MLNVHGCLSVRLYVFERMRMLAECVSRVCLMAYQDMCVSLLTSPMGRACNTLFNLTPAVDVVDEDWYEKCLNNSHLLAP